METLADFHLLRPLWLLALLPALTAAWWLLRQQQNSGSWQQVIAPELLPLLVDGSAVKQRRSLVVAALIAWLLATLAMAGPTWERTPLPVHKQESALVVLFDLSPSMLAQDLKPNRLTRGRLKLIELLQQRKEGTTALVAYAADAFVVSPLTDDAATVAALVPALDPNIMPGRGSNVEAAAGKAAELVINAGLTQADLLLITDEVPPAAMDTLTSLLRDTGDFRLSVLGIGTPDGAPIPLGNGGFAKDSNGAIVIPKLDRAALQHLANNFEGRYSGLSADDRDIRYLAEGFNIEPGSPNKQLERTFDSWHDLGYWLVLPLLPILLLAFRRGLLASVLLLPLLGSPQQAMAFDWKDLWLTPDQQAARAMAEGDTQSAQQTFENPAWKAAAAYRNGDFEHAEQLYRGETASDLYNRGNALAKAGELEEALKSYDQALAQQPEMADAQFNRELVEKLLQQQQNQQQNQKNNQGDQSQNQNNDNNQNQQQDQQNPSQNGDRNSENSDSSGENDSPQQTRQDPQSSGQQNRDEEAKQPQDTNAEQQQSQQPNQQNSAQSGDDSATPEQPGQPRQPGQAQQAAEENMSDEEKQAMEQWLRKIPDDPGGLLRQKFRYEAQKRNFEQRRGTTAPGNAEQRW
ncbi:MAG: VWA domain-containing protein [Gammaproteobacteria bacterium]|nr:MAG: VWA domain-containing protein [Gammaproteobacteria bacterium]